MDSTVKDIATVGDIVDRLPAPREAGSITTPMQMMALAIERGASVEQLGQLMALHERWQANEARKAFVTALAAFKAAPPTIIKNKSANFGSGKAAYDFAGLDQVAAVIGAALSKHGLSASWRTDQADNKVRVTCTLRHSLGHAEESSLEAPADVSGSKNAIQAIGSTVTYLSKYTLLSITGLAASGQDDEGAASGNGATISDAQKAALVDLMGEAKADVPKFLSYFKIATLDDLPASRFEDARASLQQKINTAKRPSAA